MGDEEMNSTANNEIINDHKINNDQKNNIDNGIRSEMNQLMGIEKLRTEV